MIQKTRDDIARVLKDGAAIDRAMLNARARIIREHRILGLPLVIWRDGAVVEVDPWSIELPEVDFEPKPRKPQG